MEVSRLEPMRLMISAAGLTPPSDDLRICEPPESTRESTSLRSFSAEGWMPSSVAMRTITSLRCRSVKALSTDEAWSGSRWTRMAATICGCSLRSSSDTETASIHFRLSMPVTSLPWMMRSISRLALSSPSALRSTDLMYSSVSATSVPTSVASAEKRSSTLLMRSLEMVLSLAMVSPRCWTSLGSRCLKTSAASSSPSDISRMAASSRPCSSMAANLDQLFIQPRTTEAMASGFSLASLRACSRRRSGPPGPSSAGTPSAPATTGPLPPAMAGSSCGSSTTALSRLASASDAAGLAAWMAGRIAPNTTIRAARVSAPGTASVRIRSTVSGFFHSGVSSTSSFGTWKGADTTLIESPRLSSAPMDSRTREVSLSSSSCGSGSVRVFPPRWRARPRGHGGSDRVVGGGVAAAVAPRALRAGGLQGGRCAVDRGSGRHGGLVAGRAGHARRRGAALPRALAGLLAAHRGGCVRALVGLELLGGLLDLREVHVGGDLGAQVVGAQHRLQDVAHTLGVAALDLAHVLQLLRVQAGLIGRAVLLASQQRATLVNDADGLGRHLRHAGRHQVHDAGELTAVEGAAGVEGQHHRCGGLLLLAEKAIWVGQGQVHAGALHTGDGLDRAGQLAFQATLEVQALLELGGAELLVFHQLEAHHRAFGQAGRGQFQAHVVHLVGRHQDGGAAVGVLVGHLHLLQLGQDRAAILVRQVGVEHAVVALATPQRHGHQDGDQHGDAAAQHDLALGRQRHHALGEAGCAALHHFGGGCNGNVLRLGDGDFHLGCEAMAAHRECDDAAIRP